MMLKRIMTAFLVPALLIALPVVLSISGKNNSTDGGNPDELVIVSPHTEMIKYEIEREFRQYYHKKTGRTVKIDWRNIGGTNDIARYVNDQFSAQFRQSWERHVNRSASEEELKSFRNAKSDSDARKFFLNSSIGIGVDLFFGGGTFEHVTFAKTGYAVDGGVQKRHPEYFQKDVIPYQLSGETIYDRNGRYYGTCLSSFGIASNPDRFADMKLPLPLKWTDLMRDELFLKTALADPTKSGSIMKCYEMILQQAMAELGPEQGWIEGFRRIKLIASNARYVTDSAGKLVRDISSGAAMAGMAIDFYGFSEAAWTEKITGAPRLIYHMPESGSAVTADCIQILRGAPNQKIAEMFLDFLLSADGQKLWIQKPGTPGGPEKYALLRSSVRRDLLKSVPAEYLSNPGYDPYTAAGTFEYHAEWTGRYFSLIRIMIKCIVLDPLDDLHEARKAILQAQNEQQKQAALAEISKMPISYHELPELAKRFSDSNAIELTKLRRQWNDFAVQQYRRAVELAGGKR